MTSYISDCHKISLSLSARQLPIFVASLYYQNMTTDHVSLVAISNPSVVCLTVICNVPVLYSTQSV